MKKRKGSGKSFLTGLLVLIMFCSAGFAAFSQAVPQLGDANGSGTIDVLDALLTAQYGAGYRPANFNTTAADVNGNGTVEITDAMLIAQFQVGIITSFPGTKGVVTHELAYYKSTDNYTINYPFPQAGKIRNNGYKPTNYSQEQLNAHCQKAFEDWVKYWITETNCPAGSARLHMGGNSSAVPYYGETYGTLSEFVGWGLIMCVLMDNTQNRTKHLFEMLNNFRKAYTNQYGLMMSTINYVKPMDSYNKDCATEADENLAMGLLMAHYQWGSSGSINYLAEATTLINNISQHLVERPAYVLKPAVTWGGSNCLDPCYYDSIYYPIWSKLTGDACWTKLDEHYRTIVTYFINQYGTGLVPDWCKADGTSTGITDKPYIYSWDAHQVSTKWAIHYAWYGTSQTDVFFNAAKKFAAWVKKQANGSLSSIMDSYTLDGKSCGTYSNQPGVVGAMGLSGTVSSEYQSLVNDAYAYLQTLDSSMEYNYAMSYWKVVQTLIYSGNFVNFVN